MREPVSDLTVSVEQTFDAHPTQVWRALLDPSLVENAVYGVENVECVGDVVHCPGSSMDSPRRARAGETYAGEIDLSVGSHADAFEVELTVEETEYPRLVLSGGGDADVGSLDVRIVAAIADVRGGSVARMDAKMDVAGEIALADVETVRSGMARGGERYLSGVERALAQPS